jgi:hypothetical protein
MSAPRLHTDRQLDCAFCGSESVRYTLVPWRQPTHGWWHCEQCKTKAHERRNQALDSMNVMPLSSLPRFMQKDAPWLVQRSNGRLQEMHFDFDDTDTDGELPTWPARIRLSKQCIFIDMCFVDENGRFNTKAVELTKLVETNTDRFRRHAFDFGFVDWISEAKKSEWQAAASQAVSQALHQQEEVDEATDEEPYSEAASKGLLRASAVPPCSKEPAPSEGPAVSEKPALSASEEPSLSTPLSGANKTRQPEEPVFYLW